MSANNNGSQSRNCAAFFTQEISEESNNQKLTETLDGSFRSFLPPYHVRMTKIQLQQDAHDLYTLLLRAMRLT